MREYPSDYEARHNILLQEIFTKTRKVFSNGKKGKKISRQWKISEYLCPE